VVIRSPSPSDNPLVLGISLEHGFLLVWAILMLGGGIAWIVAPARMLRWTYDWNDRTWRWLTFGRIKRTPGPKLIRDETAVRVMPWVGLITAIIGATTLLWMLFSALG
jgi:hypothetical protein